MIRCVDESAAFDLGADDAWRGKPRRDGHGPDYARGYLLGEGCLVRRRQVDASRVDVSARMEAIERCRVERARKESAKRRVST